MSDNKETVNDPTREPEFGNTFLRAAVGFCALTAVVISGAWLGLGVLASYLPNQGWLPVVLVACATFLEVCVYGSTLHDPVYSWIREPAERRAAWTRQRQSEQNESQRRESLR